MGLCSASSKCILLVINLLFWVGAGMLIFAGVTFIMKGDGVLNDVHNKPALITFGTAGLLFLCGLIGIAGAFSEKKVLLGIFSFVIVATLVLLIFVSVALFTQEDTAKNQTDTFLLKQFNNYASPNLTDLDIPATNGVEGTKNVTTTPAAATTVAPTTVAPDTNGINSTEFINTIQKDLECCGFENYTTWKDYDEYWKHENKVPNSCCNQTAADNHNKTCGNFLDMKTDVKLIFDKGCKEEVDILVDYAFKFMQWTSVAFSIFVFLGFCATMFLMCRKKQDDFNYSSIVA